MNKETLSDVELERYSRHLLLPSFDVAGQLALKNASVLIVGMGGLGSAVSLYLAASGVGRLILADDDAVDLSNLQRQVVHREAAIGLAKVTSAQEMLSSLNSEVDITPVHARVNETVLARWMPEVTIVVDCSDNIDTRVLLNRTCMKTHTPLVSGAAIRMEGQISVFDFREKEGPCYQCLYGELRNENLLCSEVGVLAPIVGVIGSLQALEAIKVISGTGKSLKGYVVLFDGAQHQWQRFEVKKSQSCPVCTAP